MIIFKEYFDVSEFVDIARKHADANRDALGFLNADSYEDSARKGKLWIAVDENRSTYLGHLMVGGNRNVGKIFQVCTCKDFRNKGIARGLVEAFVKECENKGCLEVAAKVAVDLSANGFYERMGFSIRRQIERGHGRVLNYMVRQLSTPSLLDRLFPNDDLERANVIQISTVPKLPAPLVVIDVNIYMDVLHGRQPEARSDDLITAAFAHQFKLSICQEFNEELLRNRRMNGVDPVLSFASKLPVLDPPRKELLDSLVARLRRIVFPNRHLGRVGADRDESDLTHLATAIHNNAYLFATREKAMLHASDDIEKEFGLRVCYPAEILEEYQPKSTNICNSLVLAQGRADLVNMGSLLSNEVESVRKFCHDSGADLTLLEELILGRRNPLSGISVSTAKVGDCLMGVYGYTISPLTARLSALVTIAEDAPEPERLVDHCLNMVLQAVPDNRFFIVQLHPGTAQSELVDAAMSTGFQPLQGTGNQSILAKPVFRWLLDSDAWPVVRNGFSSYLHLNLPQAMPHCDEFRNTGVPLTKGEKPRGFLKLNRFEDMIGPSVLLPPGRKGVVVPIRSQFADSLFGTIAGVQDLFTDSKALTRLERAYFRAPTRLDLFIPGTLVLFYVSGKHRQKGRLIGSATVNFSDVLDVDTALTSLSRQGVLGRDQLELIAAKHGGRLHAFTFSNILRFPRELLFRDIKNANCVSGANFVTPEKLEFRQLRTLLSLAFPSQGRT